MLQKIRLELRYAMLITLLMLLWLALEFMVGLHDAYIQYHPYVTMFAILIPVVCSRMALREKQELHNGKLPFKSALRTGMLITAFSAALAVPSQLIFHYLINPDFFDNMIKYSVQHGKQNMEQATMYFNLTSYMVQSVIGTLVLGTIINFIMAWRMRTDR
jgi:hypothetical protein